ncbi:sialate O-acetylesterase [Halomicrobium salinisoli]|uniref:sialate O-acetylesterase n=1 Tax=Halomicrobium salinisoli TaxID=2878391 RepID=UPI001CEFB324|nr:sialate O-acetylesterase [Halomicrobium salinisoli]
MGDHHTDSIEQGEGERRTHARTRRQVLRAGAATGLGTVLLGGSQTTAAAPPDVSEENFHVYLAFGQSNMEGQGTIEAQDRQVPERFHVLQDKTCSGEGWQYGEWRVAEPPLNRCWAGIGPMDYFGRTMVEEADESIHVGVVPAAVSGADIALFQKGAPIGRNDRDIPSQFDGAYQWLLDLAQQAQEVGTIKGMLFHQGETNTGQTDWKNKVAGIVSDLKSDLDIGDVPFLAGELMYEEYNGCCQVHNQEIAQLPDLIPNAHVVSAEGLDNQDQYHFSTEAYREFGRRYAEEMLQHVDVSGDDESTPEPVEPPENDGPSWPGNATDPDDDGLYEDLNGNGEVDFQDVVDYFNGMDGEGMQNDVQYYDYNGNGEVDYADLVDLFGQVE